MARNRKYPLQIEEQYLRVVERFLNAIDREILNSVKENIVIKEYKKDGIKHIFEFINKLQKNFEKLDITKAIEKSTANIIKSVKNFSNDIFKKSMLKRGLPEAYKALTISPVTEDQIEGIVKQNVELIKTVGKEYLSQIQQRIEQNLTEGRSQKELAELLERDTKVERNRAKFWASDQLGKAYSKITEKNHRGAGVSKFIWRTQMDARVRDSHEALEGEIFDWAKLPIVDGKPIAPGEDYNCRCFSEPYFE